MSKVKEAVYKPGEAYDTLMKMVIANDILMKNGQIPVSVSISGAPGLGKTTICRELAQDMGRGFFKLNLAQLTSPEELIGYYSKEYEVSDGKTTQWVTESVLPEMFKVGFKKTANPAITIPCPPDWVANLKPNSILILDDFSRGNQLLAQAIMELINEQEMIGWNLRGKNIQIFLTENPDDGEYNVQGMDKAQADRMARLTLIWDAKDWAKRAEKIGLDERIINFTLWAQELFESKKQNNITADGVSPRMMDKFYALVSTIPEFSKNLDQISLFGGITVGPTITNKFTTFIGKGLDKLPSIPDLIKSDKLEDALAKLTIACGDSVKDPKNWKSGTASILSTRLYNYVLYNCEDLSKDNIRQFGALLTHGSFSIDQQFFMVRQTVKVDSRIAKICCTNPIFIKVMTEK